LKTIWLSLDTPSQYFPLVYTVFRLEHHLWGLTASGYHCVNILFHAANGLLLWSLLRRLKIPGAWLGAALFALHPVQVESVAWVTELKNVLSLFFCLLALLAWVEFTEAPSDSWRYYAAALVFQLLALFAKTTACTLPAALFLTLWLQRKPITLRRMCQITPFLAVGIGMGIVTVWFERHHQYAVGETFNISPLNRLLIASRAVWFYLGKLIWPANLSFSYTRWEINPTDPLAYIWLVFCALAAGLILVLRKFTGRALETAALFYVAMLLPLLGFIMEYTFRYSFVADHYQYTACIGPLALAAAGIDKVFTRTNHQQKFLRPLVCALLLAVLGTLTWRQCRIYASSETLWRATLERSPGSSIARNNLSQVLLEKGDFDQSIKLSREVLALHPDPVAENNLGYALLQQGRVDDAIAHCMQSIAEQPNAPDAYYNIGQAYLKKSQYTAAITNFQMAISLKPDYANAFCNLGYALLQTGQIPAAVANYKKSLQINPDYPLAHNDLGSIELRAGQTNDALSHFRRAVELNPDFVEARYNFAGILLTQGRLDESLSQYEKVAESRPNLAQAHYMLGKLAAAYAQKGQTDRAVAVAQHALQLAQAAHETALAENLSRQLQSYR
jgi:tetratricopeptide (TPR) repeat protein